MKTTALLSCLLFCSISALAQPLAEVAADSKAEAKVAFETARGLFSSDIQGAVTRLRRAVDLDPDNCEAHQYYILYSSIAATRTGTDDEKKVASEKMRAEIAALYESWAQTQPSRAAYQYALGTLSQYSDPDRAVRHFEAAVKLNAKCGAAYDMLAICAEVRGNLEQSRAYFRSAVEAEPDNVSLWRHWVGSFVTGDVDRGVAAGLEMAQRFPDGAASIIGYLATRLRDERKAREIFELLLEKFPKASVGNLTTLFSAYLKDNSPQALALAEQMIASAPENKQWLVLRDYARAVRYADSLIAQGKAGEAFVALEQITLPRYGADRRWLDLAKARATAAGEGGAVKAYGDLLTLCVKTPTDETLAELRGYGAKLGHSVATVDSEIMSRRTAAAKPAVPFTLTNYLTGKLVSLEQYKGRVVLVNFWYPMCGPCRGEFPFLQSVLEKYRGRGFEILAINGHAPEDHMVLPLLKGWKLDFLPLKSDVAVDKNYKVRGYPANFLYGPDGRIYYEPPPVSTLAAQRELELQIEALLASAKT